MRPYRYTPETMPGPGDEITWPYDPADFDECVYTDEELEEMEREEEEMKRNAQNRPERR